MAHRIQSFFTPSRLPLLILSLIRQYTLWIEQWMILCNLTVADSTYYCHPDFCVVFFYEQKFPYADVRSGRHGWGIWARLNFRSINNHDEINRSRLIQLSSLCLYVVHKSILLNWNNSWLLLSSHRPGGLFPTGHDRCTECTRHSWLNTTRISNDQLLCRDHRIADRDYVCGDRSACCKRNTHSDSVRSGFGPVFVPGSLCRLGEIHTSVWLPLICAYLFNILTSVRETMKQMSWIS